MGSLGFGDERKLVSPAQLTELLLAAERKLGPAPLISDADRLDAAEGGCGVVGSASSARVSGKAFLSSLEQMANRGNGKGGGIAASGLDPAFFGTTREIVRDDYLLAIAYLDASARDEVEMSYVENVFEVDHTFDVPADPGDVQGVRPPDVRCYFVRVRPDAREAFAKEHGMQGADQHAVEDELVYENTYKLNTAYYASTGEKRAFVLSHARDLIVLKLVGYADEVIRHYHLQDMRANVWIGHHRYPTKGNVWHPGGAHPFIGMNEALVHNGDFANYASVTAYLKQVNRHPLFLTDTEVAVLVFDLLFRIYNYPLEYVIEALAPTTERDFFLLPDDKRQVYEAIQRTHIHGSPDGPWFFLIAQSLRENNERRLIGITDTSMLRPQVFAMQQGAAGIGVAASEKQAIDALMDSLSDEDPRFWSRMDRYWNARGGSHTDGGAFIFSVQDADEPKPRLVCSDKFGNIITVDESRVAPDPAADVSAASTYRESAAALAEDTAFRDDEVFEKVLGEIADWEYADVRAFGEALAASATTDENRDRAFGVLALLLDRRYPMGLKKRSAVLSILDESLAATVEAVRAHPASRYIWAGVDETPELRPMDAHTVVFDATGCEPEGPNALSSRVNEMLEQGARKFLIANMRGQRFVGAGFGANSHGVRVDLFGSSGDYLASGMDGAELYVHGNAQDQLAQIMKAGKLVIYGDVGQTFGYAIKGGDVFILGNAAGRPLINGVGRPHVIINGTALDYLAESFMAGDPLEDGGFALINGVQLDDDGEVVELDTPYAGGNLFSLASGGAMYVRDPKRRVGEDQLNAGEFTKFTTADWDLVRPFLEENERLFGITVERLLTVDGQPCEPHEVYRKIHPAAHHALTPEEAWVHKADQ